VPSSKLNIRGLSQIIETREYKLVTTRAQKNSCNCHTIVHFPYSSSAIAPLLSSLLQVWTVVCVPEAAEIVLELFFFPCPAARRVSHRALKRDRTSLRPQLVLNNNNYRIVHFPDSPSAAAPPLPSLSGVCDGVEIRAPELADTFFELLFFPCRTVVGLSLRLLKGDRGRSIERRLPPGNARNRPGFDVTGGRELLSVFCELCAPEDADSVGFRFRDRLVFAIIRFFRALIDDAFEGSLVEFFEVLSPLDFTEGCLVGVGVSSARDSVIESGFSTSVVDSFAARGAVFGAFK